MLAVVAFVVGVVSATGAGRDERHLVSEYVRDWAAGRWTAMYSLLDSSSRRHLSEARFVRSYARVAAVGTLVSIVPGHVGSRQGDVIPVRMRAHTRLFGTLRETLEVPLTGSGSGARVHFAAMLLFPGLRLHEQLSRDVALPPRAALLANDGTPLAQGPGRTSPVAGVASGIVGRLGPIPADQAATFADQGYPANAQVGLDGLERIFQPELAGTPGGTLRAGGRVLAERAATPGHDVKTTIDLRVERAVIAALGSSYGGMAVMDPRTGGVLGAAGIAFSGLQPPGSTMKIVTTTGALAAGIVKPTDTFPVMTAATIEGYRLSNANGEACGGTLVNAFAVSCNSVFAPIGARLGGSRLVAAAERFGFDQKPSIPGVAPSRIPSAATIGDALAVGSSAIGQGKVLATTLEMTDVAATIAMGGRRPIPTLVDDQTPRFVTVTTPHVAGQVQQMMVAVVQYGTGTAAQLPGVEVAGKTGTAELHTLSPSNAQSSSPANTDAWFVGYAPVGAPKVVVGALFPAQGAGGAAAAPPVHDVLAAALRVGP